MESLFSLEVIVNYIKLNHEKVSCLFPSVAFRLLDYPTIGIHLLDDIDSKELRSKMEMDQQFETKVTHFKDLLDKHERYIFAKGKSCLFRSDLEVLRGHLRNAPLYLMTLDTYYDPFKLLGTATVPLNKIMEEIYAELTETDLDMPCTKITHGIFDFKNLMGDEIGHISFACRLSSFGSSLLPHIGVTSEAIERQKALKKIEKQQKGKQPQPQTIELLRESNRVMETQTTEVVKHLSSSFVQTLPIDYKNAQVQISKSENRMTDQATQSNSSRIKNANNQQINVKVKQTRVIEDEFVFNHYCPPPLFYNSEKVEATATASKQVVTTTTTVEHRQSTTAAMSAVANAVSKNEYEKKRIEFLNEAINNQIENYEQVNDIEEEEANDAENEDFEVEGEDEESEEMIQVNRFAKVATSKRNTNVNLENFPILNCLIDEIMRLKSGNGAGAAAPFDSRRPVTALNRKVVKGSTTSAKKTQQVKKQPLPFSNRQPVGILKGKFKPKVLDQETLLESVNRLSRPRSTSTTTTPRKPTAQQHHSPPTRDQDDEAIKPSSEQKQPVKKGKLRYGTTLTHRMRVLASRPNKIDEVNSEHENLMNELKSKLDELSDSSRNVTPLTSIIRTRDPRQQNILSNSTGSNKSPLNLSLLNRVEMESTIDYQMSRNLFNLNSQDNNNNKNSNELDNEPIRQSSSLGQNAKFVQFGNTYTHLLNHPSDESGSGFTPATNSDTSTTTTTTTPVAKTNFAKLTTKSQFSSNRKSPSSQQSQSIDSLKTTTQTNTTSNTSSKSLKYSSNDFEEDDGDINSIKIEQLNLTKSDLERSKSSSKQQRTSGDYSRNNTKTFEDDDDDDYLLFSSKDPSTSK